MKHFLKLGEVDIAPVLEELAEHPELWGAVPWRKTFEATAHDRMDDIWFRYADPARYPGHTDARSLLRAMMDEHVPVWYRPQIDKVPAVRKLVFDLMAMVEGESLGLVIITRIPAGEGLKWHWDWGWHCDHHDKLYVTLQGGAGARFIDGGPNDQPLPVAGEFIEPKAGEVWLYDNRRWHTVVNESAVDRMTLIVSVHTEKFNAFHGRPH